MACFADPYELEEEFLGIGMPGLAYACKDYFLANGALVVGVAKCEIGVGVWEIKEGDGVRGLRWGEGGSERG
jgi:hypothetical protein